MAAGLGFKTFTTGEVLTSADVNGYLMQGVLVFADAAARDAAITSPQEGQACYLKDTDAVLTYSGTAWVGFDDSNAIQNAIVDAKGDLISATAADTPARLAVGNNGETLVADDSTSTGLRYNPFQAAGKNAVINGAMNNWQRGTSFTADGYTADRWFLSNTSGNTVSRSTDAPSGFPYSLKWDLTGALPLLATYIELPATGVKGQYTGSWTVSFWAKGSSAFTATFEASFNNGSDRANNVAIGSAQSPAITTSWTKYSYTFDLTSPTINANNKAIQLLFYTTSVTNSLFLTGVQFEQGSVATSFTMAGGTIQGELAACQRYLPAINTTSSGEIALGMCNATTSALVFVAFPVSARVTPTGITTSAANTFTLRASGGGGAGTPTTVTFNSASVAGCSFSVAGSSGLVAGNATSCLLNGQILFTGCEL